MKNQVQGTIQLHLVKNTDMDKETFLNTLHELNIVSSKLELVSSDGKVHNVDFTDVLSLLWTEFDSLEEKDEEKEKGQKAANLMTKIN